MNELKSTIMGLLVYQLSKYGVPVYTLKRVYQLFTIACLPTLLFLERIYKCLPPKKVNILNLTNTALKIAISEK